MIGEKKLYGYVDENRVRAYVKITLAVFALAIICINIFTGFEYNKLLLTVTAFTSLLMLAVALLETIDNWYGIIILAVVMASVYSAWAECYDCYLFGASQSLSLTDVGMRGMALMCAFSLTVMLCVRKRIRKITSKDLLTSKEIYNPIIVYGIIAVLIVIFFIGYKRPTVEGERGEISTLYEYSLILFIMGFFYSGRKWYTVLPLTLTAIAFCAQDLIYGGRRTSISILIMLFLVLLSHKLKFVKMIPVGVVGLILLSLVGVFRGGVSFNLEQIKATFGDLFSKKFAIDTMYSSYYTGTAFIAVISEGLFHFKDRVELFLKFLASLVLGGSALPNSNLPMVVRKYIDHWFGGMFPMYGYFYLGHIGIILTGFVTGSFVGASEKKFFATNYGKVIITWIVSSVFAWFLYSPFPLIRGTALMTIAYFLCVVGDKVTKFLLKKLFGFEFKTKKSTQN